MLFALYYYPQALTYEGGVAVKEGGGGGGGGLMIYSQLSMQIA